MSLVVIFLSNYSILCYVHVREVFLSQVYFSMASDNEVVGDYVVDIRQPKKYMTTKY